MVKAHRAAGSRIALKDSSGRHDAQLALVTSDIAEAVDDAALILCPAPAFAQADIAKKLAPYLRDGQVMFLPPATFGSMIFASAMRDAGNRASVSFAETGTLPWLTRKHGPFEVAITIRAKRLPVGVFPLDRADHALDVIGRALPGVIEPCGDALSGALMNAGPIIHPPLIVMNAGPIEHFERWDIHKEGTRPSIRRVTDALDAERIAVREALGYGAPHFPLAHHYASDGEIWMYGRGSHDRLTDSGDWRERLVLTEHRYMREDLRLGLSFLVSVAELAGVATPLAKSFLAIGGAICGEDFMKNGRTLASLGLGGLDRKQLQKLLREGFDR
jgi:opine dehydrogenase